MSKSLKTYGSRKPKFSLPSSPTSSPSLKRPLEDQESSQPRKRQLFTPTNLNSANLRPVSRQKSKSRRQQKKHLTQLHFSLDTSIIRTCPVCDLSYTKAAPDDESLHRSHCARIQRGMEWGREEEREFAKAGAIVVQSNVRLSDGTKGRIVSFRADVGGKLGSKLTSLLQTISLALSSPSLAPTTLQASKIYLFLLSSSSVTREKIAGCIIAQRISTAMAIIPNDKSTTSSHPGVLSQIPLSITPTMSLCVDPCPIPTPLGIPRIFVPISHRRLRIASHLLSAAAATFVHGCPLNKSEVAFTQPTSAGFALMMEWGGGAVRVYEE